MTGSGSGVVEHGPAEKARAGASQHTVGSDHQHAGDEVVIAWTDSRNTRKVRTAILSMTGN